MIKIGKLKNMQTMKKVLPSIFAIALSLGLLSAQNDATFRVEVSSDSILMGNYFKVTFSLESAGGENFQPPIFSGFDVVSGPTILPVLVWSTVKPLKVCLILITFAPGT